MGYSNSHKYEALKKLAKKLSDLKNVGKATLKDLAILNSPYARMAFSRKIFNSRKAI